MSIDATDGGTAFPAERVEKIQICLPTGVWDEWVTKTYSGMSLRDYFAAKSMQATISKCPLLQNESSHDPSAQTVTEEYLDEHFSSIANSAYRMADAMLKERDAK